MSSSTDPLISPEKFELLKNLMLDTAQTNPENFLKVPKDLTAADPEWRAFFDNFVKYCTGTCEGPDRSPMRIQWEKRQWTMEDGGLDELDMLFHAIKLKEKGNVYFRKGDMHNALMIYTASSLSFPCPDSFLNAAACALKQNRFPVVEKLTTQALDTGLLTQSSTKAKAFYRRALARNSLGRFAEALKDIETATALQPDDGTLEACRAELIQRVKTLVTSEQRAQYIATLPKAPPKMSWSEAYNATPTEVEAPIAKIPRPYQGKPPVF
ncbi:hypothetical protein C8J56DRAFT_482470 [Mycena floridula]|nr:hypothetical protein C8J56DRAFT_482470 [Mycena floridula]